MKKRILTIALAAIALCGFSAAAQNDDNNCNNNVCPSQACAQQFAKYSQDYTTYGGTGLRSRGPQNWREAAFEGVLLSVDQQGKIDAINQKFDSQLAQCCIPDSCTAATNSDKAVKKDRKDRRGDRADRRDDRRGRKDRKGQPNFKARSEYIAQVKTVLTPEQYVTFLENIVNMPAQRPQRDPRLRSANSDSAQCAAHHGRMSRDARKFENQAKKDLKRAESNVKKEARKAEKAACKAEKKIEQDVK